VPALVSLEGTVTIRTDLRDALRQLRRRPGFTAAALLSLALGIGANTAIFTLLDQVILRPLPIDAPRELVQVRWNGPRFAVNFQGDTLSYPAYRDIRDQNHVFSGVLCRFGLPLSAGYQGRTERIEGELVSGNYFSLLRIGAALGRTLRPDDDRIPGGHPLVVLSHGYWTARFASDPAVIGRTIIIDGQPLTIIGVAQKGFDGIELGRPSRMWLPVAMKAQMTQGWFSEAVTLQNRRTFWVQVFARLKPGVSPEAAQASLQPGFRAMLQQELLEPGFESVGADGRAAFLRSTVTVQTASQGRPSLREGYGLPLQVLMAIAGLVLLIACANVANLLLERASARQREVAVRMALGARIGQIVRHALVESLVLSMLGGACGLLLAVWIAEALVGFVATDEASINVMTVPDWRILLFMFAASVGAGLLFGTAPALAVRRVDPSPTLKHDTRITAGGLRWFRAGLVVLQVSLSLVLLIAAGMFLHTLVNLRSLDYGLRTDNVLVFTVNPSLNGYDKARSQQFYVTLLDRLRATPGVEALGASAIRVLDEGWWGGSVTIDGPQETPRPDARRTAFNLVSPGYLTALDIPLLAGRDFTAPDAARPGRVALVNESFARQYFGDRSPLGRRLGLGPGGTPADIEIVGVMKDAKYTNVRDDVHPQIFLDNDQNPDIQSIHVYLKTAMSLDHMYGTVRRTVQSLDSNVPVFAMRSMEAQADMTLATERMVASLASAFGLLATVLATVGVYAVMAFNVTRRTREIGVRVALGAQPADMIWLVQRQVLTMVTIGTAIGLPAAWALARIVRTQFYGVEPWDWISMTGAALVLLATAALAGLLPARRATSIDPVQALRAE
jgi:putative ABC transport system permease protein